MEGKGGKAFSLSFKGHRWSSRRVFSLFFNKKLQNLFLLRAGEIYYINIFCSPFFLKKAREREYEPSWNIKLSCCCWLHCHVCYKLRTLYFPKTENFTQKGKKSFLVSREFSYDGSWKNIDGFRDGAGMWLTTHRLSDRDGAGLDMSVVRGFMAMAMMAETTSLVIATSLRVSPHRATFLVHSS